MKTFIRAVKNNWEDGVSLLVCQKDYHGKTIAVVKDMTITHIQQGEFVEPTVRITNEAAQVLMDELWNCGLRPTEGTGSAGALAATQRHLEDMRTLVFKVERGE